MIPARVSQVNVEEARANRQQLSAPHVSSFDFFLQHGLAWSVADLDTVELQTPAGGRVALSLRNVRLDRPYKTDVDNRQLLPFECRDAGALSVWVGDREKGGKEAVDPRAA